MSDEFNFIENGKKKDIKKRYRGRAKSSIGLFALLIGLFCLFIFVMLVIMSQSDNEAILNQIPGLGFLDFVLALCGIIFSCRGMKEHVGFYGMSVVALIFNTCMFIVLISVYLIGLS